MTPSEFKAWFDGFTEAFSGAPTKAQWARIKERVCEIDGRQVTERVYVDRYVNRYWPPYWANLSGTAANNINQPFNSMTAMYALGKTESSALQSSK